MLIEQVQCRCVRARNVLHNYELRDVVTLWRGGTVPVECRLSPGFSSLARFEDNPNHRLVVSVLIRLLEGLKTLPAASRSHVNVG